MKFHVRHPRVTPCKYHHLFVCQSEQKFCVSLKKHTKGKAMKKWVHVPGNKHLVQAYNDSTDLAKITVKQLLVWMLGLHNLGVSLSGQFGLKDLVLHRHSGAVRALPGKRELLDKATAVRKKKDRNAIVQIIKNELYAGDTAIPRNMKHLVHAIKNYQKGDEFLFTRHPAVLTDTEQLSLFVEVYGQIKTLHKRNRTAYMKIIQSLPFGNKKWKEQARRQIYLNEVLTHNGKEKHYQKNAAGMLRHMRNCMGHLVEDKSVIIVKKKGSARGSNQRSFKKKGNQHTPLGQTGNQQNTTQEVVVLFRYHQIAHMFGLAYPAVIAKVQRALHHLKELENIYI